MEHELAPVDAMDRPTRRRTLLTVTLAAATEMVMAACSRPNNPPTPSPSPSPSPGETATDAEDLTNPAVRARAEAVVASFETGAAEPNYLDIYRLEDGRGITVGWVGFTSGTGDLLQVVETYLDSTDKDDSRLRKYLPALQEVNGTNSTQGLDGFEDAWRETLRDDTALHDTCVSVYEELYFNPAMRHSRELGIRSAAGQLAILDTIIQQGDGDDPDGLPAIIRQTQKDMGKTVQGNETDWMKRFLAIRREHLSYAYDPATREEWQKSVGRVIALESLLQNNPSLQPPLEWDVFGDHYTVKS